MLNGRVNRKDNVQPVSGIDFLLPHGNYLALLPIFSCDSPARGPSQFRVESCLDPLDPFGLLNRNSFDFYLSRSNKPKDVAAQTLMRIDPQLIFGPVGENPLLTQIPVECSFRVGKLVFILPKLQV